MLRMFRELKGSYRYIVLIFALLFGQAFCDLALPSYTSDIINIGVQQGGIPDSVPDQIREEGIGDVRDHQPDGLGAGSGHAPGYQIGRVAIFLDNALNPFSGLLADPFCLSVNYT